MTADFEHCTHRTITDEQILARAGHFNRLLKEELPDDPPYVVEDAVTRQRNLPSVVRSHCWLVRDRAEVVAQAWLGWTALKSNRQLANLNISVEPEWRRRGIGGRLLRVAVTRAKSARRTLLNASSTDRVPAGRCFLQRAGFTPGLANCLSQLTLATLDRELIARWIAASRLRAADYAVDILDGPVPEEQLEAYAHLLGVMNDAPLGALEFEHVQVTPKMIRESDACLFATGGRRLVAYARHLPSGELVGFTELSWNPKRAMLIWQAGTGVVATHRQRGIGRWLKAKNLEALLAANALARFVRTGNADSNAPMLSINRELGYKPVIAELKWQARIADIVKALGDESDAAPDRNRLVETARPVVDESADGRN